MRRSPSTSTSAPTGGSLRYLAALLLLLASCAGSEPLVRDEAQLLSPEQARSLERHHALLRLDHDVDYRVQTIRGSSDLEAYAYRRYQELGVGSRSSGGRGLLLVIDAEQDRVRVEVGQALEGAIPDAFVAHLEQRQMVPFFERERVADGILAATELLVSRIQDSRARAGWENGAPIDGSAGGGASAKARLGSPAAKPTSAGQDVGAKQTPAETVAAYLHAMDQRNARSDLDIYTADTRRMLAGWVMTAAQMKSLVRTYRGCHAETARLDPAGQHAVIRYPPDERACAPWFLIHEADRWRLDLTMMQKAIRFGRNNSWRFAANAEHPYDFAFSDWKLDRHGYPRAYTTP